MKKAFALLLLLLALTLPAFAAHHSSLGEATVQGHYGYSTFYVTVQAPEGFSGVYSGRVTLHTDFSYHYAHADFSFEGTSCVVPVTLPMNPPERFGFSLHLDEGPGIIPESTHFFTQTGWSSTYDERNEYNFPYGSITVTMPGIREIPGKFVSVQGDPVVLTVLSSSALFSCNGYSIPNLYSAEPDGSFVISVPDYTVGRCSLSCFPYGTNVLYDQYYYHASSTVPVTEPISGDPDLYFELKKDSAPELTVLINTGYVLTGTVAPAEGGYLINEYDDTYGTIDLSLYSSNYSAYAQACLEKGNSLWTYSVAVPKETAAYTLHIRSHPSKNTLTNLYFNPFDTGSVEISGDGELPPLTLPVGRDTVTVTITNPCPGYPVSGHLTMAADDGTYSSRDFVIDESRDSTTVTLTTSPNCTAASYKLGYQIYDSGPTDCTLIFNQGFFLTADGSFTADSNEAELFSFDKTEHTFTLAEYPPYLTGRIYFPSMPDDEDFSICVFENLGGEFSVPVNSAALRQDEEGRWYVIYKRSWEAGNDELVGQSFGLYYYLTDYEGSLLYDKGETGCLAYLSPTGRLDFEPERNHFNEESFTIPDSGNLQLDFTLANWDYRTDGSLLQSEHGVSSFDETTYVIRYPKDIEIDAFFDRRTDVDLIINGYRWTCEDIRDGHYAGSIWLNDCDGILTVTVPAGEYDENKFGFSLSNFGAQDWTDSTNDSIVAAVYTPADGSDESAVMAALAAGEPVHVSVIGGWKFSGILCAALYDENDRLIDLTLDQKTSRDNGSYDSCFTHILDFEQTEGAVSLKCFFLHEDSLSPLAEAVLLTTKD